MSLRFPQLRIQLQTTLPDHQGRHTEGHLPGWELPRGVEGLRKDSVIETIQGQPTLAEVARRWRRMTPQDPEPPWLGPERGKIADHLTRALLGDIPAEGVRELQRRGLELWIQSEDEHILGLPWAWLKRQEVYLEDVGLGVRISRGDVPRSYRVASPRILVVRPWTATTANELPGVLRRHTERLIRCLWPGETGGAPTPDGATSAQPNQDSITDHLTIAATRSQVESAVAAGFTDIVVLHGEFTLQADWGQRLRLRGKRPHILLDPSPPTAGTEQPFSDRPSLPSAPDPFPLDALHGLLREHRATIGALHLHDTLGAAPMVEIVEASRRVAASVSWSQDDPAVWQKILVDDREAAYSSVATWLRQLIVDGEPPAVARARAFRNRLTEGMPGGTRSRCPSWSAETRRLSLYHYREEQLLDLDRSRQSDAIQGALRRMTQDEGPGRALFWHAEDLNGPWLFHERVAQEMRAWLAERRLKGDTWHMSCPWPAGQETWLGEILSERYHEAFELGHRPLEAWVDEAVALMRRRGFDHLFVYVAHTMGGRAGPPEPTHVQALLDWWRDVFLPPLVQRRDRGDRHAPAAHIHPVLGLSLGYRGPIPGDLGSTTRDDQLYEEVFSAFRDPPLVLTHLDMLAAVDEDDLVRFFRKRGSDGLSNWPERWGPPTQDALRARAREALEGTEGKWAQVHLRLIEMTR